MRVLHITAHLGGGVGKALSSILSYEKSNSDDNHLIMLLDEPENNQYIDICISSGVPILFKSDVYDLNAELMESDIVILHWWHHPVMARLLATFPEIPIRLVIWSHVNGCNYPVLPFNFLNKAHKIFFTSPFSFDNNEWDSNERKKIRAKSCIVYGLGRLQYYSETIKKKSNKFIIGYIGTLEQSKINPRFVEYCNAIIQVIPDVLFVVVGDIKKNSLIKEQVHHYNIEKHFEFTGYAKHTVDELKRFDIFSYPLNPMHYGTTENAILEAMAFGVPVVALNHNSERYIIEKNLEVGYLADSIHHYKDIILRLYHDHNERQRIARNAQKYVKINFNFEKNALLMRRQLNFVNKESKSIFHFNDVFGSEAHEWLYSCLGVYKKYFVICAGDNSKIDNLDLIKEVPILMESNKSSIPHYSMHNPNDRVLRKWKSILLSLK